MKRLIPAAVLALAVFSGSAQARSHCGQDESWLTTSMKGDRFEIEGGQMALQKSTNPAVRALAQTLITDHRKSLRDAAKLARRIGLDVPRKPTESEQWELETAGGFGGSQFDWSWTRLEVLDHRQDIVETKDEVKLGCSTAIRRDARKEIPTLRKHLRMSRAAHATTAQ